jgi:hypothetical protein
MLESQALAEPDERVRILDEKEDATLFPLRSRPPATKSAPEENIRFHSENARSIMLLLS